MPTSLEQPRPRIIMMRSTITLSTALYLISLPSHAADWYLEFAYSQWQQAYSGDFQVAVTDIRPVDVQDDLSLDKHTNTVWFTRFDHNIAWLPRFKYQDTVISEDKYTHVDLMFELSGYQYDFDRDIYAEMRFDHTDLSAYYPVFSNDITNINIGITLRRFDGFTYVATTDNDYLVPVAYELLFKENVPLLYTYSTMHLANIEGSLGVVSAALELQGGDYHDNRMFDMDLSVRYQTPDCLGITLGYRYALLDLEDFSGIQTDIVAQGPYLGVALRF